MNLKEQILHAGLELAARYGIAHVTRDAIAARVSCAGGSVSYHLGDAKQLRRALVEAAIERRNLLVVGAAIGERHPSVQGDKITDAMRSEALRAYLGR
jgi:AcrR family transcriptional regulator